MAPRNNIYSAFLSVIVVFIIASENLPTATAGKQHELANDSKKLRFRRNVRDLYDMMTAAHFKTMKVAEVLGYGRFCGMANSAAQFGIEAEHALAPVDAIDGCCKAHDACYDELSVVGGKCRPPIATQLSPIMRYLTPYYMEKVQQPKPFKKGRSVFTSAEAAGAGNGDFLLQCKGYDWSFVDPTLPLGWIDTCGVALCECDYTLAKCLKQNEGSFNRSHLSARSLVDQASDQFGPAARHSLELLRTGATIGKVHSNVMEIFDFFSSWAPKTTAADEQAAAAVNAVEEEARRRSLDLSHQASSPWFLWG